MDYGLSGPTGAARPDNEAASRLLNEALDLGINFFDTAPAYGCSEEVVGRAIGHRLDAVIATKVSIPTMPSGQPMTREGTRETILRSLTTSCSRLRRDCLDVVQIHNATAELVRCGDVPDALVEARDAGLIRCLGASVYGELDALEVIESGCFDLVQIAYNILDQRMAKRVLPAAAAAGVGVIIRSAFLKGVLTPRGQWLDEGLELLGDAAARVVDRVSVDWETLPRTALRFCASASESSTVLVGVRTGDELRTAVDAVSMGPLDQADLADLRGLALDDDDLLNPSKWPKQSVVN